MNNPILHKDRKLMLKLKNASWLLLGLCTGLTVSYLVLTSQIDRVVTDNTELGKMINMQSDEIAQLRLQLGAPTVPETTTVSTLAETPLTDAPKRPTSVPAAPPASVSIAPPAVTPKPPPAPVRKPVVAPPQHAATIAATAQASSPAHPQTIAVSTPQAATAPAAPSTAGIKTIQATFSQANIAGMDGSGVTFRTGLSVKIGGMFPSGEKLLSVSPAEKKIVTDRRVILLKADDESVAQ